MARPVACAFYVMRITSTLAVLALAYAIVPAMAHAEQGILVLHVCDVTGRPIQRVQLSTKGDGSLSALTDTSGRTRIRLADQTRPKAIVALTIVRAPKDLVFISPWDSQVPVPPFENETQNFASIVLAERGDRALLENKQALAALASRLNLAMGVRDAREASHKQSDVLKQTAAIYGLQPLELDEAIRAWGSHAQDPYEKGLAALYQENFVDATSNLTAALKAREEKLEREKRDAADAAFFLGQALYRQGKYAESAATYRKALAYRPGDPITMNNLALSLLQVGDYGEAQPLLQTAIAAIELAKGRTDPDLVYALNNSGALAVMKGDLVSAEAVFRRGLDIRTTSLGKRDVRTANSLANVASVLLLRGDDAGAEPLLAKARDILEAAPPPFAGHESASAMGSQAALVTAMPKESRAVGVGGGRLGRPGVASVMLNLATIALHRNRLDEAKRLAEEVRRTEIQTFGPHDPEIANALQVLGQVALAAQDYADAANRFAQSLDILQAAFGSSHPALVDALTGAGDAAASQLRITDAANAYRRAIEIRLQSFGQDDAVAAKLSARLRALGN